MDMKASPHFQEWTADAVRERVVEAARTLAICPRALGPKAFGNAMPEPLRRQTDAYASNAPRYRRRPSAAAIARMEECWTWINRHPDGRDRQRLYDWARARAGCGGTVKSLARKEGVSERTLRRDIARVCAAIAHHLNGAHVLRTCGGLTPGDADRAEGEGIRPTEHRSPPHWRAPGARPKIDPDEPSRRLLSHRTPVPADKPVQERIKQ
ncbi:DUF6362 family protein [Hoeflea prorocentri]|uniref:DUF6362 family protein n=1 Tax=Hoeflea prorocentri TaxID=1922333 RepID=A0A9X3UHZ9_9HYPH|nr:DUF6362 family protein [Hoeflea prorocentri]MCY6381022.1 DUF6362 family protein [Hoeflea prorocentri]MDA5398822.1 DUF6362 family protein [Hoeflea prorocentri]